MIDERFIVLGALISAVGALSYLISTLKGKVQPNKVSWLLWSAAPLIAFAAQIKQGVGLQALMTFMVGFNPLIIFAASFLNKKAYWKISRLDIICGILSVAGLILWMVTKVGNIAIIFSIFADGIAYVPTIVKAYKAPYSENYAVYVGGLIGSALAVLTFTVWDFAYFAFPLYIIFANAVTVFVIIFRRHFFTSPPARLE